MPHPDRNSFTDIRDQTAFDLVCLALAFNFFHEIRHVKFLNDKNNPAERPEEEIACDVFARSFLTGKLAAYAKKHEHEYSSVLAKRSMGIALGAIIVHAITPPHAHWGTSDYPPIADRISGLINGTRLPDDSSFWIFAACMLVGIMRQSHRPLSIVPVSPKKLVEDVISML